MIRIDKMPTDLDRLVKVLESVLIVYDAKRVCVVCTVYIDRKMNRIEMHTNRHSRTSLHTLLSHICKEFSIHSSFKKIN